MLLHFNDKTNCRSDKTQRWNINAAPPAAPRRSSSRRRCWKRRAQAGFMEQDYVFLPSLLWSWFEAATRGQIGSHDAVIMWPSKAPIIICESGSRFLIIPSGRRVGHSSADWRQTSVWIAFRRERPTDPDVRVASLWGLIAEVWHTSVGFLHHFCSNSVETQSRHR